MQVAGLFSAIAERRLHRRLALKQDAYVLLLELQQIEQRFNGEGVAIGASFRINRRRYLCT